MNKVESKVCQCSVCERNRYYTRMGIPEDIREYISELEMQLEVNEAIFNGQWPSGKEQLLKALAKYE